MEKVLVVDDSKFSRLTTKKILTALEYEVIGEAVDGLDGIEKFKELKPTLVITDLEMPNLNGLDMIRQLRLLDEKIKVVVVTSMVNGQVIQDVVKQRASMVKKPLKELSLQNAIKLLDE